LANILCKLHGSRSCGSRLDLSASRELCRLTLYNLPVDDVVFVPENLIWCQIGILPDTVAASVIGSLCAAQSLERLVCHSLKESALVQLVRTVPNLASVKLINLCDIDLRGQEEILLHNLKGLKQIELYRVTLTAAYLRQLMSSLPTHGVFVALGHVSKQLPVTIKEFERSDNIIEQIAASPNTEVHTNDGVVYEDDKCVVKRFWFSNNI